MRHTLVIVVAVVVLIQAGAGSASPWPHWRGPSLDGSADEQGLPESWGLTENVAWVAPLPGEAAATPIVWDGRVFISSMDRGSSDLLALGFDAKSGKELWRRTVAKSDRRIPRSTLATPSPTTDGKHVFFLYASGDLAAFDLDGNPVWSRNIETDQGNITCQFGYGSSPLLCEGRLIIMVLRRDRAWREPRAGEPFESFLLAVDPATGKDVWRQARSHDALNETMDSYASPIPYSHDGRTDIVVMGADYITGHDPATGEELWRYGYVTRKSANWRMVSSPVSGAGLIFASRPRGGNGLFALRPNGKGLLSDDSVAWNFDGPTPDVSTPLLYGGNLYVLDGSRGNKVLTCLDPATGKTKWQGPIGNRSPWRASLTAADGKIYCVNEGGEAIVLAAGGMELKVLSRVDMPDTPLHASVAIAEGRLFLRTAGKLYCIGK
jgi:outer membrane protein assembly factor BamB